MTTKQSRRRILEDWVKKLETNVGGSYALAKREHELVKLTSKLTANDLAAVNALIAAAYATAGHDTRQWFREAQDRKAS